MKKMALLVRVGLGLVFLAASWDKLLHPAAFAQVILNYQLLPGFLISPAAVILPWLELVCGLFLLAGIATGGAALLYCLLFAVFLAAEGSALWRGLDIACGCFSADPTAKGGLVWSMLRDSGLLFLSGFSLFWSQRGQRGQ